MTDGRGSGASSSIEEDPAELGVRVNAANFVLRENNKGVAVADLGEEDGVLFIRGRPRPRLGGGPAEMDLSWEEAPNAGDDLLLKRVGVG